MKKGRSNKIIYSSFGRICLYSIPLLIVFYYLIFYIVQHYFILPDFFNLQKKYSIKNVARVKESIFDEINSLANMVSDWAMWDDTYIFVKNGNKEYIKSNLIPKSLWKSSKINLVYIYDNKGEVKWCRIYDPQKDRLLKLEFFKPRHLSKGNFFLSPPVLKNGFKGILITRYGIMFLAGSPILRSSGEGPSRGVLVMGRFITPEIIKSIIRQTKVTFSLHVPSSLKGVQGENPEKIVKEIVKKGIYFSPGLHQGVWRVYGGIRDLTNRYMIIEAHIPTPFIEEGQKLSNVVSGAILTMVTILVAVLFMIFRRYDLMRKRQYDAVKMLVKEKTQEIRLKTTLLGVLINSMPELIFIRDMNGKYILYNEAFKKGFKIEMRVDVPIPEESLVDKCPELFSIIRDYLENQFKEGREYHTEKWIICPDKERRYVEISLLPFQVSNTQGIICIVRDLTERENMRIEREKMSRIDSLGVLAGGIAHDFNNMLTAILGNISIARQYLKNEPAVLERLELAEDAALNAKELAGQLLTFSKGGEPVLRARSIKELVEKCARFVLTGQNIQLKLEYPGEEIWPVVIDDRQISQVIQNLIINAREAMPRGGTITIGFENLLISSSSPSSLPLSPGKYVCIHIKDEGEGIPQEHLPKIFEPYFTTKEQGNGLGLAICYSIMRKHGGYITVESEEGKGTLFKLYLPASPSVRPHEEIKDTSLRHFTGCVIVMDDDQMIRELLINMLEFLGLEVIGVKEGRELLEIYRDMLARGKRIDLVILDLTIRGGMGGKETMEKLLRIDPHVKAVLSSGYIDDDIMANFKKYGFKAILRKPYTMDEMVSILGELLPEG